MCGNLKSNKRNGEQVQSKFDESFDEDCCDCCSDAFVISDRDCLVCNETDTDTVDDGGVRGGDNGNDVDAKFIDDCNESDTDRC